MAVMLTKSAAEHVNTMLEKKPGSIGLRLATEKSGCTGFGYVVDYAEAVNDDDQVFESHGVKVVVDNESLKMVDGTEIDFVKNNVLNQGFEFKNPNIKDMCGCGESFNV